MRINIKMLSIPSEGFLGQGLSVAVELCCEKKLSLAYFTGRRIYYSGKRKYLLIVTNAEKIQTRSENKAILKRKPID